MYLTGGFEGALVLDHTVATLLNTQPHLLQRGESP